VKQTKEEKAVYARAYYASHKEQYADKTKTYRSTHKEKIAVRKKAWGELHKEDKKIYDEAYRVSHKEKMRAWHAAWYIANKDQVKARQGAYNCAHKQEIAERGKAYRLTHAEQIADRQRAYITQPHCRERKRVSGRRYAAVHKEELRAYRETHRTRERDRRLRETYGISTKTLESMLVAQGNACAICGRSDWPGRGPHVDHNHSSGLVRGILCIHCNQALGHAKDDISILTRMIGYLRRFNDGAENPQN
jgi:hypothetical protein